MFFVHFYAGIEAHVRTEQINRQNVTQGKQWDNNNQMHHDSGNSRDHEVVVDSRLTILLGTAQDNGLRKTIPQVRKEAFGKM